jgi:hypothetical protein
MVGVRLRMSRLASASVNVLMVVVFMMCSSPWLPLDVVKEWVYLLLNLLNN